MTQDELAAMRRDPAQARFNAARLYVAPSPDGGRTFGLPRFIADVPRMFGRGAVIQRTPPGTDESKTSARH